MRNPQFGRDFVKFIAGVKWDCKFYDREFVNRNFLGVSL